MSSCSDTEHSETGFQKGSEKLSEDSALEHGEMQQRKNKKKTCKKRKRVKKVVSDSENSSETEESKQAISASKKRRKTNCDQTPNHTELQQKTQISSGDETEEKSPVDENNLVASISSGAETEERKSPVKGDRISDNEGKENVSDSSTSQDKPVKNERGSKKQEVSENEEHSPSHPHSPFSKYFPGEGSGSKQHFSDSSDDTSDTDEGNKSLSQIKKLQHNSKSSESTTPLDNSETAEMEELKSGGKKLKHKAEKEAEKDSLSSSSEPLSKYSDNRQKSMKNNQQHTSSASSDGCSDNDEKIKSMSPRKKSQNSSNESVSESCTSPDIVDKKEKRKSDGKRFKNKTQKNPGNMEKTNPKIERLKKYLRVAGLRVRSYQKLWEGCKTNKAKTEKLLQMLTDAGLKGKPTLQKCKRLQAKRERKEEFESLDVSNIITSERGRPKRNTPSLFLSRHTTETEENSAKQKDNSSFSRIKNIVDSDENE